MSLTPIEWFCDSDTDRLVDFLQDEEGKIDLTLDFGWEQGYLWKENEVLKSDIPNISGIYVIKHLYESEFLYVGQSQKMKVRLRPSHHKLGDIIEIFENFTLGCFSRDNVINDIIIYYKEVDDQDFKTSLKRCLIWCESLTIGILKPIYQENIEDIQKKIWDYGGMHMNLKSLKRKKD